MPVCATLSDMSFENPPPNARDLAFTDFTGADFVDLFIGLADRAAGAVGLLLLDERGCVTQPVVISDVPAEARPEGLLPGLALLGEGLGEGGGAVAFVRARPGAPLLTPSDRAWVSEVDRVLTVDGQSLLRSAWLATPTHIRQIPQPRRLREAG